MKIPKHQDKNLKEPYIGTPASHSVFPVFTLPNINLFPLSPFPASYEDQTSLPHFIFILNFSSRAFHLSPHYQAIHLSLTPFILLLFSLRARFRGFTSRAARNDAIPSFPRDWTPSVQAVAALGDSPASPSVRGGELFLREACGLSRRTAARKLRR